jgi:Tol biopolymer transport system component
LYVKDASGTGAEAVLLKTDKNKHHLAWSPDGRFLAYEQTGTVGIDLWMIPMFGPSKPEPVLQGPANEGQPAFSPDSRFLAYVSNESGRNEVYVQTFPPTGGRWQISTEGGIQPRWRRDGREMFYLASGGRVMALDVELKGPRFGAPKPLFQTWLGGDAITEHFAVTSDGQRFLLTDQRSGGAEFTVVLNWQRLLSPPATAR